MFDPTSFKVLLIISLLMPLFSFTAAAFAFPRLRRFFGSSLKWTKKKTILVSLLSGTWIAFLYLMAVVLIWLIEDVSFSLSGIGVKILAFAVMCGLGLYIGIEVASRVLGQNNL